jgi:hypothetical protein
MVEVTRQDLKTMQRFCVSHVNSICVMTSVSFLLWCVAFDNSDGDGLRSCYTCFRDPCRRGPYRHDPCFRDPCVSDP